MPSLASPYAPRQPTETPLHFHTIVVDGVFVREPDGALGFVALPEPTRDQLHALVSSVARRAIGWLRRHRHLSGERAGAGVEPTALDACVAVAMQRTRLHKLDGAPPDDADDPAAPSLAHRARGEHAVVRRLVVPKPRAPRAYPPPRDPTDAPIVARARDPTDLLDFDQSDAASLFE